MLIGATLNRSERKKTEILAAARGVFLREGYSAAGMLVLWEASPRTVGALGEALDLESSTLTPLLKRLEAQGLVARTRDPEDERRVVVTLTETGAALRDKARAVPEQLFCKLNLQLDELGDLRERLKALAV